jgi:hypothetical protein
MKKTEVSKRDLCDFINHSDTCIITIPEAEGDEMGAEIMKK